jgi:hypothetical protein
MPKTLHWVVPCTACNGVHPLTQPMSGDPNPYLEKEISFICPVTGVPVTVLGSQVRLEMVEPLFPPLVFRIKDV